MFLASAVENGEFEPLFFVILIKYIIQKSSA